MDLATLTEHFLNLIPTHQPMNWEAEEYLEPLAALDTATQEIVLVHVPVIWPVSHSLCYSYLARAGKALTCLNRDQLGEWVAAILDIYEHQGLRQAQEFMTDVEANFLCRIRGEAGVLFSDVVQRLQPYGAAIADRSITLGADGELYTDTETIFLPREISLFKEAEEDFLLYKLMITAQAVLLRRRTYELLLPVGLPLLAPLRQLYGQDAGPNPLGLNDFFTLFPEPRLVEDLFTLAEAMQIHAYLAEVFPGLWRDAGSLLVRLIPLRPVGSTENDKSKLVEALYRFVMAGRRPSVSPGLDDGLYSRLVDQLLSAGPAPMDSAAAAAELYQLLDAFGGSYVPVAPLIHVGRLRPAVAAEVIRRRREDTRDKFVKGLAAVLPRSERTGSEEKEEIIPEQTVPAPHTGEEGISILPAAKEDQKRARLDEGQGQMRFLTIDNRQLEVPEMLQKLAKEIIDDLGHVPTEYISAAQGMAGRAVASGTTVPDEAEAEELVGPLTYDEWDFRRNGFRKNWCLLLDKAVQPVRGTFVANTLTKYHGLLLQMKKQFEMLRRQERFVRRQRYGDDIDVDALIEAISDAKAGLAPSERLFVRLLRDQRDIAAVFLVDMSSSTEGWVGQALKEALILMGEALAVLGDRFAIYGFSGMRRLRSDFYRIKDFEEPYNRETKGRIAAIAPQEYTRMGPPLRHAATLLGEVEARVRLLIVLSDGKPEDYDDYKGEYAVEDTRHALIEAKAKGIHPFCITIDRQAHDYIDHMYGEVNYIFVDDVRKLPARLPEIYRNLTT